MTAARPDQADASGLERALRDAGIPCVVDAFERLAVIVAGPGVLDMSSAERRRIALGLIREYGFTHLALELTGTTEPAHDAALRRD